MNDWTVTPLAASLGARVDGVRLTEASEVELGALQDLLDEHHVLEALRDAEIPVCAPLRFPDGDTLHSLEEIHYAIWPRTGDALPTS